MLKLAKCWIGWVVVLAGAGAGLINRIGMRSLAILHGIRVCQ
jgi:hypothetical protein